MIRIVAVYDGYPIPKREAVLSRLSTKNLEGSGFGFGGRDYSWVFKSEKAGKALASKLRRYKWLAVTTMEAE